jgi:hypothetical protein
VIACGVTAMLEWIHNVMVLMEELEFLKIKVCVALPTHKTTFYTMNWHPTKKGM